MIGTWIAVAVVAVAGLIFAAAAFAKGNTSLKKTAGAAASILAAIAISALLLFRLYGTEEGRRSIKDFESNVGGGIERIVKVYDMEGDLIASYQGRFDVAYDSSRIVFDDENGKRHIIYYTTGTVIIDEI